MLPLLSPGNPHVRIYLLVVLLCTRCSTPWPQHRLAYTTIYAPSYTSPSQHPSTQSLTPRRQIFEKLGIKQFKPTLLDEAATKLTSESCKPSRFTTFDEACAHPEATHSMHHGQAGPVRMVTVGGIAYFPPVNDAAVLKPKVALSNAREPSAAPETASTAEALGPEPPCPALQAEKPIEPRLSQCRYWSRCPRRNGRRRRRTSCRYPLGRRSRWPRRYPMALA